MPRVVHFELHADDPERAIGFYEKLFGWKFNRMADYEYWLIVTGSDKEPGINGGLIRRKHPITAHGIMAYVCTIDVEDLDASLATALAAGATLALAKQAIPSVGWLAYVKDTEGNVLGMHQHDPNAA